jgi:hypothetical protein
MFALGVICFFHPMYDTQGHIIPTLEQIRGDVSDELRYLAWWLRPTTPQELQRRVDAVSTSRQTYEWLRDAQLRLLARARQDDLCYRLIDERLKLR